MGRHVMKKANTPIGRLFASARRNSNMNRTQFGRALDRSDAYRDVYRWETGANLPPLEVLAQLVADYDIDPAELGRAIAQQFR